jgi:guanylate kinase
MLRDGLLVIVSGPSGAGKGTVLKALKENNDKIRFSISATTRNPREGETEGQNYFFKTTEQFQKMIHDDQLVEWVEYCNNYYGTPKSYVEDSLKLGYDVILEIEVEGARNIRSKYPECVSIFILPPSFYELKKRIEGRGTEDPAVIKKRMDKARKEVLFAEKYDYIVTNDTVEKAAYEIKCILNTEKLKLSRNFDILSDLKQEGFI